MRSLVGALRDPDLDRLAVASEPWVDEPPEAIRAILDMLLPVALAAVVERADRMGAPRTVLADLHSTVIDPAVDDLLADPAAWEKLTPRVDASGARLATILFPQHWDAIVNAVAALTQTQVTSVATLLRVLLPVVIKALRRLVRDENLGAEALYTFLMNARRELARTLDPGLIDELEEFGAMGWRLPLDGARLRPRFRGRTGSRSLGAGPFAARGMWRVPLVSFVRLLLSRR